MRSFAGLGLLPLLVSASPLIVSEASRKDSAPLITSSTSVVIPDSYIIVLKDHVTSHAAALHHSWVQDIHLSCQQKRAELQKRSQFPFLDTVYGGLRHTYNIAGDFLGYSGHFDEETLSLIRSHPDVEYVEKDSEVHTMKHDDDEEELEKNAPWGLARISHRNELSFGNFNKYLYTHDGGEGVDVYVIDTGTNIKHVDFEGRASWGKTIPEGDVDEDGNGHGTHCSGTVAGKKYGVAKKAHVKAVKVLRSNGSGSMSDVAAGVDWAVSAHLAEVEKAKDGKRKGFKGSTANMSLGGGKSTVLDRTVNAAVEAGLHFAVAAGNDNADSCNYSPAAAEKAVTVGASTLVDERAYFSNFGKCNDIFAPGLNIQSTWTGSNTSVKTISGTSMASPHIAGLLAYMLSLQPSKESAYAVPDIKPAELKKALISIATKGALGDVPSSTTNLLAWNGGGSGNFTDIVGKGGYTVGEQDVKVQLGEVVESATEQISAVSDEAMEKASNAIERIEDFVAEELKGFFEEMQQ